MFGAGATGTSRKGRLLDWLDVIAKLIGATAVVLVAILANSLQSKITGISMQSQREQSESQLRANMFTSLIGPIVGSQKDGTPIPADREQLLVELLALNFYENFELKPLMEDASRRLAAEADSKRNRLPESADAGSPEDVREPLWSIARRIAERQKASIAWERASSKSSSGQGCEVYFLTLDTTTPRQDKPIKAGTTCSLSAAFRDAVHLRSPDGEYTLGLWVTNPDWHNQTVGVTAQPFLTVQERPNPTDPTYPFTLTWFNLPFTDNTLLPDGNRFAVYLRTFFPPLKKVVVVVMWFPKSYFTPRERPLNYGEIQKIFGKTLQ